MGSAVRLMTVMYETNDRLYQLIFLSSVCLNLTICAQCLLYWNNKLKKPEQKKSDARTRHERIKEKKRLQEAKKKASE